MKKRKNTKKINKKQVLITLSILLPIIALLINKSTMIRVLLCIISSILIIILNLKNNKKYCPAIFILYFILLIILDSAICIAFKRIPIFSYNIVTTGDVRVYNAVGIRVWQCDKESTKNLKVDMFNNKGYLCSADDIDAIDSNSFLNSVVENYDTYKDSYIKINGKISKKNGQKYIEMQPYETNTITINGYVNFADNITLRIMFSENEEELDSYDVYDEISVIGKVKNIETINNKHIVYMDESRITSKLVLKSFTVTATTNQNCQLEKNIIYENEEKVIYTQCLNETIVNYQDGSKYELSVALSANKLNIEDLYRDTNDLEKNEETGNILYKMNSYNILVCNRENSKDIIIGDKSLSHENTICDPIAE